MSATDIRRAHRCELPHPLDRSHNDITQCDECDRLWVAKDTLFAREWRRVSRIKRWRLRRQLALEGGAK